MNQTPPSGRSSSPILVVTPLHHASRRIRGQAPEFGPLPEKMAAPTIQTGIQEQEPTSVQITSYDAVDMHALAIADALDPVNDVAQKEEDLNEDDWDDAEEAEDEELHDFVRLLRYMVCLVTYTLAIGISCIVDI
ncbi:hypothetical protein HPB50_027687 [Hyalomma asiaticum]|nr:hypothetical protein HPB50_027687 [Hyalomma asiaticum]